MPEALEIAMHVLEDGITLVTLIAVLHAIFNWHEARKKRESYARMESKIDALLRKEGIEWNSGRQNELQMVLMSLKRLSLLYSTVISQAEKKLKRRVVKVEIRTSKAWISAIITFIFGKLALHFGVKFDAAWANTIAQVIVDYGLPALAAWLNKTKVVVESGSPIQLESNK